MMWQRYLVFALQIALTLAFLYFGGRKLISHPLDVAIYDAIGFGQWPRFVTGSVEVACAIALWIPGLQVYAALGLVGTMIVGTTALIVFAGLPFWHLIILGAMALTVAFAYRGQLPFFHRR